MKVGTKTVSNKQQPKQLKQAQQVPHTHTCTHLYWHTHARTHTPFAGSLTLLCEKLLGKVHMSGKCCCCCCFCSGKTFTRLIFLSNLKCTRCCSTSSSSSSRRRRVACSARCSATHGGSSSLRCPKHRHTHAHTRN